MGRKKWIGVAAVPAAVVVGGSLLLWADDVPKPADDNVFARISGIDCDNLSTVPPMNMLPNGTSDGVVREAIQEGRETTLESNTPAEIARIACARVDEQVGFGVFGSKTIDVHLGVRQDSQDPNKFARAITGIYVDKPEWDEPREIEGGFIILGQIDIE